MTSVGYFLLVVLPFIGLILALFQLQKTPSLSRFEMIRLSQLGDPVAKAQAKFIERRPALVVFYSFISLVFFIIFAGALFVNFGPWRGGFWLLAACIIGSILIFGKSAYKLRARSQRLLNRFEARIYKFTKPLLPVLKRLYILKPASDFKLQSREELEQIIKTSTHVLSPDQINLLSGALGFSEMIVKDVMTSKRSIKNIEYNEVLGPLVRDELHKTGLKIFPVTKKSIDNVIGWLKMGDLRELSPKKQTAEDAMSPAVEFVLAEDSLQSVLQTCLQTGSHLFIVVNDKRQTVGIISLSDIINALFGRK